MLGLSCGKLLQEPRLLRLRDAGGVGLLDRTLLGLPLRLVDWHLPPELALLVLAPGGSVRCGCKRLLQPGPKQWRLEPSGSSAMLLQKVLRPGPSQSHLNPDLDRVDLRKPVAGAPALSK